MQIRENFPLKSYNTFGIDAKAKYFASFSNTEELLELTTHDPIAIGSRLTTLILGGGSNILFTQNFDGLVLKNEIKGMEVVQEDEEHIYVSAGAGENWHQFVLHCIKNNWAGVENLSLIPGNVGASPMQNIGAYGVEISETFHELKAFHLKEKTNHSFRSKDCAFGYRDSIFKNKHKDKVLAQHPIPSKRPCSRKNILIERIACVIGCNSLPSKSCCIEGIKKKKSAIITIAQKHRRNIG